MNLAIARLLTLARSLLTDARRRQHPSDSDSDSDTDSGTDSDTDTYVCPYSCAYVAGPTVHRTGERPPCGEDSPLVRPYFLAHEQRVAGECAVEARRRRVRGGALLVAVHGVQLGQGAEVGA
ncbi:hypothetical protein [Streptomyces sp. NPDC101181]|uniref:hypothetical protein n=1 Tax=Streptomyces sp. NPDC101181 TaxID=3366125 RepID=UPI00382AADB9